MSYKCVNCGTGTNALFKTYGPSVLKLTKCESCKCIVDKYIEYDPVIVMIDLVLISKEAQRHIIYNTKFKSYWKLFIILTMLETYGVWHNDSLFNIAVNTICDIKNNNTINSTYLHLPIKISLAEPWSKDCRSWEQEERDEMFIWEKDFYIQFLSTFSGIAVYIITVHLVMSAAGWMRMRREMPDVRTTVCAVRPAVLVKSFSLAYAGSLLALPMLVWGAAATPPPTRLLHYALVSVYGSVLFYQVFTVLYEGPKLLTVFALTVSYFGKYLTMFHTTPLIRNLLR